MKLVRLIFLILLVSPLASAATAMNSSLLMFSLEDAQACPQRVEKLKSDDARILFVPTLYFLQSRHHVKSYCSFQAGHCLPMSAAIIEQYERAWTDCFSYAIKNGVRISVMPHLDDGSGQGQWRNEVSFDSLKKYGGFSYHDIMSRPLMTALENAHVEAQSGIDFTLMGEMGAPVFAFPQSNLRILTEIKTRHPDWQLGMSLNHNSVNGLVKNRHGSDTQNFFDACDFVGISAYHEVHAPVRTEDFATTIMDFKTLLNALGVKLKSNMSFHFSEVGLGGGYNTPDGTVPAATPEQAAKNPWAGFRMFPYQAAKDPWQKPELKKFRNQFYEALLQFMSKPSAETHLVRVFNWSDGPWNFQTNFPNVYADPDIQHRVRLHNLDISAQDQ